jgi:hypothetical protein
MRFFLLLTALFSVGVVSVSAYEVEVTEVKVPYEIVPLTGDFDEKRLLLGKLDNFPVMYGAIVVATTTLSIQLAQRDYGANPLGLSLMVVRVDDTGGGVTEVGRVYLQPADWQKRKDSVLGMTFLESALVHKEIGPGTYRIEVSTPDNLGSYMLTVGEIDAGSGYFDTVGNVRLVQKNFGFSVFTMLRSSYVYYPLGILFLLFMLQRTWKYRKVIAYGK